MRQKLSVALTLFLFILNAFGQKPILELSFTAVDNNAYVQFDSMKAMNRTRRGDTVLYYPDTVLTLEYQVGIQPIDYDKEGLQVFQNYPNPVSDQTTIILYVPEKDKMGFIITDIHGRQIIHTRRVLDKGYHSFRFTPGTGNLFFFTAQWKGHNNSIKIMQSASESNRAGSLEYIGSDKSSPHVKTSMAVQGFSFIQGDTLLYICYSDTLQAGMLDAPEFSGTYTFQFATNMPCPGTPTVTYEGQVYNTIQVFSQCWMKENLNAGIMINGNQNQTNNGILEKYCNSNSPDSCSKYGGLYQWDEMMQYTTQQGSQGICPAGWHLPTDEEWLVLEGAVDSQFGIGHTTWDSQGLRGFDAGKNLKTSDGWNYNGNGTDLFGFSAMPGSYRILTGGFDLTGAEAVWWMSKPFITDYAWYHNILFFSPKIGRFADSYSFKDYGFSVRCLRDN